MTEEEFDFFWFQLDATVYGIFDSYRKQNKIPATLPAQSPILAALIAASTVLPPYPDFIKANLFKKPLIIATNVLEVLKARFGDFKFGASIHLEKKLSHMDDVDSVWISMCYPVEFKENDEGVWIWKYVDNAKGRTTPILVPRAISYVELYEIVKGELKIDSSLYEIEMSCFDPNMPHVAAAPTIIDSDNNVKWFVSICRRAYLCVAVSGGAPKNREQFNIGALELRNDDEEQLENMSRGKDIMQTKSVSIEHNGGGMLLDWNNIQCIPYSPQRPTPNDDDGLLLLENSSNSLVNDNIDDNEVDVDGLESPIMNLTNANAPYHINGVSSQVVISSFSLVRSSSSVRIPEGEDIKAKQLFSTKKALTEKLQLLALKFHFEFKVKKSDKSVYTIVCVDENCGWRLRATKMKNSEIFVLGFG
ncbi:hypothetical protein OROHE_012948 [Orobanche hederae]